MRDGWREYWEERPTYEEDYRVLGHGTVVNLLGKAAGWHSRRFVDSLAPNNNWRLLDAGCGAGDEIVRFHKHVRSIVAADFSLAMLRTCKRRLESLSITDVNLVAADVRALPFKASSFDASICMGVLLFLTDSEVDRAFSELARVSRQRMLVHGKNSFSPFGAELRLAERLLSRVRNRKPYDRHRPAWWYRRKLSRFGRPAKDFSIGLWIPQMPYISKVVLGSLEVLAASLGFSHPFGKEYYVTVLKKE